MGNIELNIQIHSHKMKLFTLAVLACNACLNKLANANVTTTDVKFYAGSFTTSNTNTVSWSVAMCDDSKHWQATAYTNPVKGSCVSKPSSLTEIADCKYRSINQTAASTYVAYCNLCDKGKAGNATYTSCSGSAMSNCDYQSGTDCYYCKTDYAVNHTASNNVFSCTAYTTDNNCRKLLSAGVCGTCWDAYYFNGTTCKLFAKIFAAGLMLAASIFFY